MRLLTLAFAALLVVPAVAQNARPSAAAPKREAPAKPREASKKKAQPKAKAPEAAPKNEPAPEAAHPYDPQLTRLASVMGSLAFLSDLCASGDGDDWREKLSALLEADAPAGPRRQTLVGAFNRGFRGFELTYRDCTPNARAAIARYLAEADRIAADVMYRYGAQ